MVLSNLRCYTWRMEDRLTELEIKICHQDQIIEDLNQLVIQQQEKLDKIQAELKSLKDQTVSNGLPGIVDAQQEPPPPHY